MRCTSRTGLLASPTKKVIRQINKYNPHLKAVSTPAPFAIKPYAGLYNPFPQGCSLLCNHPADGEARKMLRKAKENLNNEGKSVLHPDEVAAIRAGIEQIHMIDNLHRNVDFDNGVEDVPEELFRRYTEMDSRPLTPAPTLASVHTRASAARRCVTPDPIHTSEIREKTLLVLDLRKSHSQETLSWYGSNQQNDPPLIRVTHIGTNAVTPVPKTLDKKKSPKYQPPVNPRRPRSSKHEKSYLEPPQSPNEDKSENEEEDQVEGEGMKRRGKKRKKHARDSSRASVFRTTTDPETLVATIGPESYNPSARPSISGNSFEVDDTLKAKQDCARRLSCLKVDSYLHYEMLRQLRRELTEEIVELEFNMQRKKALEEAMKTIPKDKIDCEDLIKLKKEITLPVLDTDLVLYLPRLFTRSSARFELPMDSRTLIGMTPLEYLKDNVFINSTRKLLYNYIFKIFTTPEENETENINGNEEKTKESIYNSIMEMRKKRILGMNFREVLDVVMGGKLSEKQFEFISELIGWKNDDEYDFKTFCSINALCERLLAKEFYQSMPDPSLDPRPEVERLDFEALDRKLFNKNVDERLVKILRLIKDS